MEERTPVLEGSGESSIIVMTPSLSQDATRESFASVSPRSFILEFIMARGLGPREPK